MKKFDSLFSQQKNTMRNKIIYVAVVGILTFVALVNASCSIDVPQSDLQILDDENVTVSDAEFQVHVIDVGQGDSILVSADGQTMLIDAAESSAGDKIVNYLTSQNVTELNYAVATHLHADHIGSFPKVFDAVKPQTVIESICPDSLIPTTKTYENYLDAIDASGAEYKTMQLGDSFMLGNAQVTVLAPVSEKASSLNNTSLVLRVQYDDIVCIFTGDMETPEENSMLSEIDNSLLRADFLKAGHHGSDTSSGEAFLEQVKPKFVAISCGVDNKYGHPAESTIEHLKNYTPDIYITAQQGDIVFYYDKDTKTCNITASGKEQNS